MKVGGSIFLIAIGAIITFALDVSLSWLDLKIVGWVLMVAGVLGLVLTMLVYQRRRSVRVVDDGDLRTIDEVDTPSAEI
jgi:hypothetical protein